MVARHRADAGVDHVRPAGDAVITGAGLFRIDQQGEGTPSPNLVGAGDAQHRFGICRPVNAIG